MNATINSKDNFYIYITLESKLYKLNVNKIEMNLRAKDLIRMVVRKLCLPSSDKNEHYGLFESMNGIESQIENSTRISKLYNADLIQQATTIYLIRKMSSIEINQTRCLSRSQKLKINSFYKSYRNKQAKQHKDCFKPSNSDGENSEKNVMVKHHEIVKFKLIIVKNDIYFKYYFKETKTNFKFLNKA